MRFLRRLAGAVAYVFHALYRASVIRGTARLPRRRMVCTYLKLKAKHFLIKLIPGLRFQREKLFANEVAFFDYFMLVCLYETIFVNRDYAFESRTERPLVIDCGSNVGLSVLFQKIEHPGCRVVAFEPDPQTFEVLQGNVKRNGWEDVTLHNKAVHRMAGPIDFYHDPQRPGWGLMSTEKNRGPQHCRKVEAVLLSDFVQEEVDFLKLDIEGAEAGVLEELAEKQKLRKVREMVMEYHHHLNGKADGFSKTLRLLEENGFGYEIAAYPERPMHRERFLDILVYAYRQ